MSVYTSPSPEVNQFPPPSVGQSDRKPLESDPSGTALPEGISRGDAAVIAGRWLSAAAEPNVARRTLRVVLAEMIGSSAQRDWVEAGSPSPCCTRMVSDMARSTEVSVRTWQRATNALAALGMIEIRSGANGYRGPRAEDGARCGISLEPIVARILDLRDEYAALAAVRTGWYRRIREAQRNLRLAADALEEAEGGEAPAAEEYLCALDRLRQESRLCLESAHTFPDRGGGSEFDSRLDRLEKAVSALSEKVWCPRRDSNSHDLSIGGF